MTGLTRRKPKPVKQDLIEIPKELIMQHHNIELCIDTMFINGCGMLTAIDRTIKYRSLVPMEGRKHMDYYRALDKILCLYNGAGFIVRTIQCDREYQAMMDQVKDDLEVDMNYTSASEHVPEAERNNHTIKERIRAAFWCLPYNKIPQVMIRYLAMECTEKWNIFPVKGGVSEYFSPHMLLKHKNLHYDKHCLIPFGAFVQVNHEPEPLNSNAP